MYGMARSSSSVATLVLLLMGLAATAAFMSSMQRACSGRITSLLSVEVTRKTSRSHNRKMLQVFRGVTSTKYPSPSSQSLAAKAVVAQPLPLQLKVQLQGRWRLASRSPTLSPALMVQSLQRLARRLPPLARVLVTTVKAALILVPSSPG